MLNKKLKNIQRTHVSQKYTKMHIKSFEQLLSLFIRNLFFTFYQQNVK